MWSLIFFFCIQLFPAFFIVQVFQSPGFSESSFFRVQVFLSPGFSGSRFFWVQVLQGPGFSACTFFWVQVFQGPVQGLGPGFRSSRSKLIINVSISDHSLYLCSMLLKTSFLMPHLFCNVDSELIQLIEFKNKTNIEIIGS